LYRRDLLKSQQQFSQREMTCSWVLVAAIRRLYALGLVASGAIHLFTGKDHSEKGVLCFCLEKYRPAQEETRFMPLAWQRQRTRSLTMNDVTRLLEWGWPAHL